MNPELKTIDKKDLLKVKLFLGELTPFLNNIQIATETKEEFNEVYEIIYKALNN